VHPILLHSGALVIGTHGTFSALGAIMALLVSWRLAARRHRADGDLLLIMGGGVLVGALFGRFGLLFRYLQDTSAPTLDGFVQFGGQTLLGGLTGAYLGVVLTKRAIGYTRHTGDLLAPGVALGIAIGRIGCFLTERAGTPTTLPFGVRVDEAMSQRWSACTYCRPGQLLHASFLYEIVFLAWCAWWLSRISGTRTGRLPWMQEGDTFKLFLLVYAIFRFAVEFVRGNPVMAFGLSGSQLMVVPASVVLGWVLLRHRLAAGRSVTSVA
jgi:prolipoprotein diacylglyceryltransferase